MNYINRIFEKNIKDLIVPVLKEMGFIRYKLPKGWIYPTFLFKHETRNLWYGTSYDWRDNYYEAELGYLYKFRDVLPRVVIVGFDISSNKKIQNQQSIDEFINGLIVDSKNSLQYFSLDNNVDIEKKLIEIESNKKKQLANYIEEKVMNLNDMPFVRCPR